MQNVFSSFALPIIVVVKIPSRPFTCIKYTATASLSGKHQVVPDLKNRFVIGLYLEQIRTTTT